MLRRNCSFLLVFSLEGLAHWANGPVKVQAAFGIFMSVAAVWLTFIWDTKENIFPEQLSSKPYSIIKIETITD